MTETSNLSTQESRIIAAADEIRHMTDEVREDSARGLERRSPRLTEQLRQLTRKAPLQSLTIAFLLGMLIARRR
jgi:hypothetical protein